MALSVCFNIIGCNGDVLYGAVTPVDYSYFRNKELSLDIPLEKFEFAINESLAESAAITVVKKKLKTILSEFNSHTSNASYNHRMKLINSEEDIRDGVALNDPVTLKGYLKYMSDLVIGKANVDENLIQITVQTRDGSAKRELSYSDLTCQ